MGCYDIATILVFGAVVDGRGSTGHTRTGTARLHVELQMCEEVVVAPFFSTVVLNNMDSMQRGPNCGGGHRGPIVG